MLGQTRPDYFRLGTDWKPLGQKESIKVIVTTTIDPGNTNFENSLFILKGLASKAGTPKKFSDLVLFVYLSNSRMVGFQKIAEPIFDFFARRAIKKGRLNELVQKYCK